ncbi:S-phase kinase-associated protein 1 [Tanacetum coccineum]
MRMVAQNDCGDFGFWKIDSNEDEHEHGIYVYHPHPTYISGILVLPSSLSKAVCRLQIRSLLDVTTKAVVDMIIGKNPEEIHKMFNIKQDLTFEEIVEMFERDNWCFE